MTDVQQVDIARIIARSLNTDEGRVKLATSMIQPTQVRLDFGALHNLFSMISPNAEPGDGAIPFEWSDTFTFGISGRVLFDRLGDKIHAAALESINRTVIAFADDLAGEPGELENWPDGTMVMNARSFAVGPRKWPDFEQEGQRDMLKYGRLGLWKDMVVRCTRHVENGRVYQFGPAENLGEAAVNIDIMYNAEQSTDLHYVVDVKLGGFIQPVKHPQVGVTIVEKPALIAH